MSEKSILEQALLQVQTLEEAVKHNAKGILASTMKQELSDLLKESMEEEEKPFPMDEVDSDEKEKDDTSEQDETDDEDNEDDAVASDDEDVDNLDNDDETEKGIDSLDSEMGDDETDASSMGDDMGGEEPSLEDGMGDDDVMDMTGASDDEVLKVFKAMKPEDGIVVKKDGNDIEFGDGEDEYIIKLDDESDDVDAGADFGADIDEEADMGVDAEVDEDMDVDAEVDEETIFEIDLNDEDINEAALKGLGKPKKVEPKEEALPGLKNPKKVEPKEEALPGLKNPKKVEPKEEALVGLKKPKKVEVGEEEEEEVAEAARTKSNVHGDKGGQDRAGLKSKKMYKAGSGSINEEVETLKKQNAEYKKALVLFKDKLNEVAVFNANLAYATRLFTEHSTTKQEKLNILKRFDTVSTLNESKGLYNSIASELGNKTTVTESIATKISNTPSTSSTEVLSEAKAYENPQFKRMKDLMSKIK
jgi:hypothetical protein